MYDINKKTSIIMLKRNNIFCFALAESIFHCMHVNGQEIIWEWFYGDMVNYNYFIYMPQTL